MTPRVLPGRAKLRVGFRRRKRGTEFEYDYDFRAIAKEERQASRSRGSRTITRAIGELRRNFAYRGTSTKIVALGSATSTSRPGK